MKKYFNLTAPFVVPATDGKLMKEHHGVGYNNQKISSTYRCTSKMN
jgi:hypothetical protein